MIGGFCMQITRSMNRLEFGERKRIRKETDEAYKKTQQYTLANKSEVMNALLAYVTGGNDKGTSQAVELKKDSNHSTLSTLNQIQEAKLQTACDEFLGDVPFEFNRFEMDLQGSNQFSIKAIRSSIFAQTDLRIFNEAISKYAFQMELANNRFEVKGPRSSFSS